MREDTVTALIALATVIGLVALVLRLMPPVGEAVLRGTERRNHALDGLRGIVALCVVAHHSILMWMHLATGRSGAPPGNVANQLGSGAVAIFFMISAYLFCGKIIGDRGRLRLLPFAEGRVMRIVPLYLACVAGLVLTAFAAQQFRLVVAPAALVRSIIRWLAFDFVQRYPIDADPGSLGTLGQVWTLRYEWMLYAILPLLAWGVRAARGTWPIFAGLALCALAYPLFAFFVAGAASVLLVRIDGPVARRLWQDAGVIGLVAVVVFQHDSHGWKQAVLLTPFMVAVLQGHRGYALLGLRPLRYLGEISYGIYLTHGFTGLLLVRSHDWHGGGAVARFALIACNLGGAVALSTVTFLAIERPLMGWRPLSGRRPAAPMRAATAP